MTTLTLQEQVDAISLNEALAETGSMLENSASFIAESVEELLFEEIGLDEATFIDAAGPHEQPTDAGVDNLQFFNQNRAPQVNDNDLTDTLAPDNYFQHQNQGEAPESSLKPSCATSAAQSQSDMVGYLLGINEASEDSSVKFSDVGGVVGGVDTGSLDQGDDEVALDDLGANEVEGILSDGDMDDDEDDGWDDSDDDNLVI
jgi:hypothetical protein